MTESTKPYLIRAIYEWCVDQGFTPYVAAAVDERTRVPPGYARDGQIVLNVSADATNGLQLGNDLVTFQARFAGKVQSISIPVENVLAIYARENGHGMAFEVEAPGHDHALDAETEAPVSGEPPAPETDPDPDPDPPPAGGKGGHLRIVK
ncbi:MAG: ClpXP protease specificity-enhancing factor [Rhodocyclaceae bacterium]|nr:ClpXP protease specificity-enhancing factor [Rhodocyclaceae bacterium]